ncbi:MAG: NAD-dependent epimerase/dehydratase family protein [Caulobacterales bacterium]|nr:NAD-dependent epimerase/dehydratase family protein [Caulobacterales bacterium]
MAAPSPLLVLGATSLVGRFALPRLEAAGLAYRAVSRGDAPGRLQADIETLEGLAALPRAETVLSFSPVWLLPGALEALKANGLKRLIAFSSTSVVTKAQSSSAYEQDVVANLMRGEDAVRASGIDWTILRPTLIYAEGLDGNVSRLAGLARRFHVLPISGHGEGRRQPVHADDLAGAAIAALTAPAAIRQTYALAGGETLSYRAVCERIFEGLGMRPRILSLPPPLWRAGLALASPVLPGTTAQMGERMERDLVFDDAPARRDLGWSPRAFRPRF